MLEEIVFLHACLECYASKQFFKYYFNSYDSLDLSPSSEDHYLLGHVVDGRVLLPAAAYLWLAWQTLAFYNNEAVDKIAVQFDDVTLHRATILNETGFLMTSWFSKTKTFKKTFSGFKT